MKKEKLKANQGRCRRGCGRIVINATQSLIGITPEMKEKYDFVCRECATDREIDEFLKIMSEWYSAKVQKSKSI